MNEFTYFDLIVSKLRPIKVENMKRQDVKIKTWSSKYFEK